MPGPRILVTDFDGTITNNDFYRLITDHALPPGTPDFWAEYLSGKITHFEAINNTFGAAAIGEARLSLLATMMEPDPELGPCVESLTAAHWSVVVASAGCQWYIDRILTKACVRNKVEVHSNPGRVIEGRLVMTLPRNAAYFSEQTGVDKVAIVKAAVNQGGVVAFAGDGPPDLAPALLVRPELRFARGHLAQALTELNESFRPYSRWSEVARALVSEPRFS